MLIKGVFRELLKTFKRGDIISLDYGFDDFFPCLGNGAAKGCSCESSRDSPLPGKLHLGLKP